MFVKKSKSMLVRPRRAKRHKKDEQPKVKKVTPVDVDSENPSIALGPANDHTYCGASFEKCETPHAECAVPNNPHLSSPTQEIQSDNIEQPKVRKVTPGDVDNESLSITLGPANDDSYCVESFEKCETPQAECAVPNNPHLSSPVEDLQSDLTAHNETASMVGNVMFDLKLELAAILPSSWICVASNESIQVSKLSSDPPCVIQRSLLLSAEGSVTLSVHGKDVKFPGKDCGWFSSCLPICKENIKTVVDQIDSAVTCIRQLETCVGANDSHLSHLWKRTRNCFIDENLLKDTRFIRTCRSNECSYLVRFGDFRCGACAKVQKSLRKRGARRKGIKDGTPNKFKSDKHLTTPEAEKRKKRYRKINRNLKLQNGRLRLKISKLLQEEGVHIDDSLSADLSAVIKGCKLTDFQKLFLDEQVKASKVKSSCGRRWHPSFIKFALDILLHSPTTYNVLERYIILPSRRQLFDYSHVQRPTEGIYMSSIEELSEKVANMEEFQKYHILAYDEVHISKNLVYDKGSGSLIGYCKLSEVDEEIRELEQILNDENCNSTTARAPPLATKVLSFMCSGVTNGVCEVVSNFTVSTLNKEELFEKHWSVVEALETAGVKVIGSVSDGAAVNRGFIEMHQPITQTESGITFDTENMYADGREFYFFSDTPHLLKTIRNCFCGKSRNLTVNGKKIDWKFILHLYHSSKGKPLRKAFKLNAQSVFLTSYSRMNVSYAAQVLSKTVANALTDMNLKDSEETIKFILMVDKFFDCLNGAYSFEGFRKRNDDLKAYSSIDDIRFEYLFEFLKYLKDWSDQVDALRLPAKVKEVMKLSHQTLQGIEITIRAFDKCVKFLLSLQFEKKVYIMARVFSQDKLEHRFGRYRSKVGGSQNPNVGELLRTENTFKVLGSVGVQRKRANVQVVDSGPTVDSTPLPKRQKKTRTFLDFSSIDN